MTNFIPIFPLALVVFPGEPLHLHIFEERYKQLINDCFALKKPFGIPSVIGDKMQELGTVVEITEISKVYEDGKMDIKTKGIKVFKTLELIRELPDKLYSGAIVTYTGNVMDGEKKVMQDILLRIRKIHEQIGASKDFKKPDEELISFDIAHHIGLTTEEEYMMLEYHQEMHRLEYIKRHLKKVMGVMDEVENMKTKIRMNGHFKNLEGFDF
jgi:Lon protease-like protein